MGRLPLGTTRGSGDSVASVIASAPAQSMLQKLFEWPGPERSCACLSGVPVMTAM